MSECKCPWDCKQDPCKSTLPYTPPTPEEQKALEAELWAAMADFVKGGFFDKNEGAKDG